MTRRIAHVTCNRSGHSLGVLVFDADVETFEQAIIRHEKKEGIWTCRICGSIVLPMFSPDPGSYVSVEAVQARVAILRRDGFLVARRN